ncbi:hypothetical protein KUTeg_023618 [Tegillarca granosa]|uniref:Adenylate kinase n=1 Tax=Tegillarca granosa TaxID=220873 RepID=A0ABQ9E267_TEGGR|nr:hypothetical protein KUTeg_023618 [Tegillarca granosa]
MKCRYRYFPYRIMGCAPSSETPITPRKGNIRRGSIFKREKVSLKIDKNVGLTKTVPHVIFVFGGPGSGRGKLLSDAAEAFGLVLLNMERILLDSLYKIMEDEEDIDPWKRSNSLQKLVRSKPELLRVDFVLKQLTNKLKTMDTNRCYLVDFMPNLKFILLSNVFIKECSNELRNFETMYPVSFAIHLSIPPDKYEKKKRAQCAQIQTEQKKQNEATTQSDEVDTSRTSKRFTLHHNSLKHFLDYFSKHDKLVTLDVSSGDEDLIWERIYENELDKMNIGRFQIQVVSLSDIVNDEKDEPVSFI